MRRDFDVLAGRFNVKTSRLMLALLLMLHSDCREPPVAYVSILNQTFMTLLMLWAH